MADALTLLSSNCVRQWAFIPERPGAAARRDPWYRFAVIAGKDALLSRTSGG